MRAARGKPYRRSWKNLLLNKRYQLRFTFLMVGLSALLMLALGLWVLSEAEDATRVDENATGTPDCDMAPPDIKPAKQKPPTFVPQPPSPASGAAEQPESDAEDKPAADGVVDQPAADEPAADENADESADKPVTDGAGDPAVGAGGGERERPRPKIDVEISDLQLTPEAQEEEAKAKALHLARCERQKQELNHINDGYERIRMVLIIVGLFLVIGLTLFGIKMTHRVAGPLYKVTLYFDKLRKGVYDQVYSLRKGDQLVEFYEHFKAAHAGIRSMEEKDIEVLRDLIAAADEADLKDRSPDIAKQLDEMRAALKRKEESLETSRDEKAHGK